MAKITATGDNHKASVRMRVAEQPNKCQLCQKSFAKGCDLKMHLRTHNGEKPYTCQLCLKSYTQSGNLKRHMMTHTGVKPYKCELCQKSFGDVSCLKRHLKAHAGVKPYKCQLCEKSFAVISGLNRHMPTHSGDKPYRCEVCNKRFACNRNLWRHRGSHASEKKPKSTYPAMQFLQPQAGTQTQCLEMQSQSSPKLPVRFTALTVTDAIDVPNETMLRSMHPESSGKASPLAKMCLQECLSISIARSPDYTKPFLEKSFGCGICDELLDIEKEFQDHCSSHRFSPPDEFDMF